MSKQEFLFEHNEPLWTSELERVLGQNECLLTNLAEPGHVLTEVRLAQRLPNAGRIVEQATEAGIDWPTRETAVPVHIGARSRLYFDADPATADARFASEAVAGQTYKREGRGFNNFYAILRSEPFLPGGIEDFSRVMMVNQRQAIYGSKPYLLRAYAVVPEFMAELQQEIEPYIGVAEWNEAIVRGGTEPEAFPKDAALLRSCRLAYGLLMNLMRADDSQRQSAWCGLSDEVQLIDNPEVELWT